ncbi:FHA domain-containing protein [Nocardioides anomalus]|uniref:FHA domain-containing protein n=1 Tax=Nocardioides anomalus TaxID=2712223 RepID=A0A6G6W8T0_9ACTN|nr:RDD family protein [Nocardioides anomalus]QIG41626.1 FHA domain-containing protein [Nocardioides anomalus]
MADTAGLAPATPVVTTDHLVATADRRFYAFVVDRLLLWGLYAGAAYAAWAFFIDDDRLWVGVGAIAGAVVFLWLVVSLLVGRYGLTPGKALLGLRVLSAEDARPVGVGKALVRNLVLGVATLPTVGFGAGALAWTAMMDPTGWRRGWHDLRAGTVVVDVRPVPVEEEPEEEAPRQVVNLTAMRLVPASPTPPRRIPTRGKRPPTPPPPVEPQPAPTVTPRQGLGWPLVGDAPAAPPPAGPPAAPADERTRPRAEHARWQVRFDTGEQFEVRGLTLVGRRPEPRPSEPVKRLVALPSDDMSLSKTHAQFQVVPDGALVVMDRGSTNGSLLVRGGVVKRLAGGRPATLRDGDKVRFGDREMTVAKMS